jgi:hypothetical protein
MADFLAFGVVFWDTSFLGFFLVSTGEGRGRGIPCLTEALYVPVGDFCCAAVVIAGNTVCLQDAVEVWRSVGVLAFCVQPGGETALFPGEGDKDLVDVRGNVGDERDGEAEDLLETSSAWSANREDVRDEGAERGFL